MIARNQGRREKNLWTDTGSGAPVVGYVADSEHDEARFIAQEIDALAESAGCGPVTWPSSTARTPSPAPWRRCSSGPGCPTRWSAAPASTSGVRSRTPSPTCGRSRTRTTPSTCGASSTCRGGASGTGPRRPLPVRRAGGRLVRAGDRRHLRSRHPIVGLTGRARNLVAEFGALMGSLRDLAATATPAEVLDAALDRSGYLAELRASEDPQDATRVENLAELHAVAAEFSELDPEGDLGDFLGAGRPRRRLRSDPGLGRGRRPDHAHDRAHREGPRVPRGVRDRHGGRHLPAPALPRRSGGALRGAAAGLRRPHPGPPAALPHPRGRPHLVGDTAAAPRLPLHRRDPGRRAGVAAGTLRHGDSLRRRRRRSAWGAVVAGTARARSAAVPAPGPDRSAPRSRPAPASARPPHAPTSRTSRRGTASRTTATGSAPSSPSRGPGPPRWPASTSGPRGPNDSCCGTRRWRSSDLDLNLRSTARRRHCGDQHT